MHSDSVIFKWLQHFINVFTYLPVTIDEAVSMVIGLVGWSLTSLFSTNEMTAMSETT